jgi:translation initiation factor IF-2
MEEERKIPRLGKAAGEFNVGTSSIVAVLKKKGIDILDNPNTKLTPDMYDILVNEFQEEKKIKSEIKKIDIGGFAKAKLDEDVDIAPKITEVHQPEQETPVQTPPPTLPKESHPYKVEVNTLKIIGKINIEDTSPKKKVQTQEKSEPVAIVVETPEEDVPEVAKESVVEEKIIPKVLKKTPEHIDTVVEPIKNKIKIIDKINPDDLPGKKKKSPLKQKKELETVQPEIQPVEIIPEPLIEARPEIVAEVEIPVQDEVLIPEPQKEIPVVEHKIEHIETTYTKLQAPKIMGKIDLPVAKVKEPVKKEAVSHDVSEANKKNKKRKRIKSAIVKPGKEADRSSLHKKPEIQKEEISKEDIDRQIKETMQRLEPLGKSKTSKRRKEKRQHVHDEMRELEKQELEEQKILKVTEFITANELSTLMNVSINKIIATCMSVGLAVSINQRLDAETISLLTDEFGYEVEFVGADSDEDAALHEVDKPEDLEPRHPVVVVMGHVDHGKTSLLDYVRKSNVIAGEAGGITQHIGAYEVSLQGGKKITFLDTPGHEAFTAMRARGAKVTDLCIIVIAADDSIMPQTIEAINHAQAAGIPMVFAITKIDKPTANPEKIKEGLANMNILVEDWGGKYQCQEIDAKHGTNVNELLEKVLLEAELLELKANPNRSGIGTVIESALDKGKGYVAKVLVQNGTVKIGDPIVAGGCYGKVRTLYNERNQQIKFAGPATPVLLLGLNGAPQAGDVFKVANSEHDARIAATKRAQLTREMGLRTQKHITLDEIGRRIAIGDFKELNIIVKGDVDGSVEALSDSLLKLSTEQIQVNVIHKSVGAVTESDVLLASASNAVIVAFQVRPSAGSRKLAEQEEIDIRIYSVIYNAINEIKDAIAGMRTPEIKEKIICNIEVREIFKITKVGTVAGCLVLDGKLQRNSRIHLIRDGIVIYTGKLGSLRRFKDDVKEVLAGQDCGLNIESCNDIKVGDIIEGYEEYEVKVV